MIPEAHRDILAAFGLEVRERVVAVAPEIGRAHV